MKCLYLCINTAEANQILRFCTRCHWSTRMGRMTVAMWSMDIVREAVKFLNPEQVPVVALDQPLFAIAKLIQWNWPEVYGEDEVCCSSWRTQYRNGLSVNNRRPAGWEWVDQHLSRSRGYHTWKGRCSSEVLPCQKSQVCTHHHMQHTLDTTSPSIWRIQGGRSTAFVIRRLVHQAEGIAPPVWLLVHCLEGGTPPLGFCEITPGRQLPLISVIIVCTCSLVFCPGPHALLEVASSPHSGHGDPTCTSPQRSRAILTGQVCGAEDKHAIFCNISR